MLLVILRDELNFHPVNSLRKEVEPGVRDADLPFLHHRVAQWAVHIDGCFNTPLKNRLSYLQRLVRSAAGLLK